MRSVSPLPSTSDVISQLRLPLIVLVTYAHSYSAVPSDYRLLTSGWDTLEVLRLLVSQTMVKVVVPVFFIISGYLFFARMERWSLRLWRDKMLRRARSLLIPYVAWNLVMAAKLQHFSLSMLWNYWPQAGQQTDWLGGDNWMTAPANLPLWFLRDLMVVSLLTPVIYWLLSRRMGGVVMAVLLVAYLSGVGAFALPGLSVCSVFFFSLGAWVAIRRRRLVDEALRMEKPAYVLSAVLAGAMVLSYHTQVFSSLMLAFRLTGAVAVFCLAYRVLSATRYRIPPAVAASSYFVYLAHFVLFFSFLDRFMLGTLGVSPAVHYLCAPLLKALLLVAVYRLFRISDSTELNSSRLNR